MAVDTSLCSTEDSQPLDDRLLTAAALSQRWLNTDHGRPSSPESRTTFFHPPSNPDSPASSTCPSPQVRAVDSRPSPSTPPPSSTPPARTTRHARTPRERRRQRTHPSVSPFAARRSRTAEEWLVSSQDAEWFAALSQKSQDLYLPPRRTNTSKNKSKSKSKSKTHSRHMDSVDTVVKPVRQQRPRNFSLPAPYHGPRKPYSNEDREVVEGLSQHQHPTDARARQEQPQASTTEAGNGKSHIRRSSFRQTLSLTSPRPSISSFARPSMSGFPRPSLFPQRSSWSYSKKVSNKENSRPAAPLGRSEYYQDPEARRKLRVYLGSPQKFEEVLAYGFPSTAQQNEVLAYQLPNLQIARDNLPGMGGDDFTFLHDGEEVLDIDGELEAGDGLLDEDNEDDNDAASSFDHDSPITPTFHRASYTPRPFAEIPTTKYARNAPLIPSSDRAQAQPRSPQRNIYPMITSSPREMTLRMTLTRPDLRADEDRIYRWHHQAAADDSTQQQQQQHKEESYPTAYAAFNSAAPSPGQGLTNWDDAGEESGRMKRLLRRMRSGSTKR